MHALFATFERIFKTAPALWVRAPGRVNLIGEHTDYNCLPVLPMAIDRAITLVAAPADRPDTAVELHSLEPRFSPRRFDLHQPINAGPPGAWENYVKAAARCLLEDGPLRGARLLVAGDIPPAAGLSSSSALVVASALVLLKLADRELARSLLATRLAEAERFVGTESGGMDQAVCLLARDKSALYIDFDPLRCEPIRLPSDWRFVVSHSLVEARKAADPGGGYNVRVGECQLAVLAFEQIAGDQTPLRHLGQLVARHPDKTADELLSALPFDDAPLSIGEVASRLSVSGATVAARLPPAVRSHDRFFVRKRARHVLTEARRVGQAKQAALAGDLDTFGALMNASHRSCRDDYQVSCDALETLVAIAHRAGAAGSRLTGAGFGGCTVSLVRAQTLPAFLETLERDFYQPRGKAARTFVMPSKQPVPPQQIAVIRFAGRYNRLPMAADDIPDTIKLSGDGSTVPGNILSLLIRIGSSQHPLTPRSQIFDVTHVAELTIGRTPTGQEQHARDGTKLQLELDDPSLSTHHALLRRHIDAGGVAYDVEDLESTNGCQVNGIPVNHATPLVDGDILETGSTFWRFFHRPIFEAKKRLATAYAGGSIEYTSTVSPDVLRVFSEVLQIATTDLPVIVNGESGTGKEGLAQLLHEQSSRGGPLVALNCAAIPDSLVESELFGHRKGAFTGAISDKPGLVEAAQGGTLLLDEIADMPLVTQAKLLRLLQEHLYVRVGETTPRKANVRFIAATHQDLRQMVDQQRFRGDLYARLNGLSVTLPPLRERREDIGLLLATFLSRSEGTARTISRDAYRQLLLHDWPFNIRELQRTVAVATAFAGSSKIRCAHLPPELREPAPRTDTTRPRDNRPGSRPSLPLTATSDPTPLSPETEGQLLDALRRHQGNVSQAARDLDTSRVQIYRWLKRLQVDPKSFR